MPLQILEIICGNANIGITPTGGIYETFINNTDPETSVKGTIVIASTTVPGGVDTAPAGSAVPIGVIYESGIVKGANVKVVTCGKAEVLLVATETSTTGYWCGVSSTVKGRMYQLADAPVGSATHNQEIGHSLQTVLTPGSLSLIQMHFN